MRPVPQAYWPVARAVPDAEQKAVRARRLRMGERIELATSLINREISVDQASRETGASREQVAEWVRRHGSDRIIQLSDSKLSRAMPPCWRAAIDWWNWSAALRSCTGRYWCLKAC